MKPGTLVKWKVGGIAFTGRIVSNGKSTAHVAANGNTYEVTASQLQAVPVCLHCGGPMPTRRRSDKRYYCCWQCYLDSRPKRTCKNCGCEYRKSNARYFCSHACRAAYQNKETDKLIFAALVEYKKAHDGLAPNIRHIAKLAHCNRDSVGVSLSRLDAAGKIRFDGTGAYRGIIVVGARWTYEESS